MQAFTSFNGPGPRPGHKERDLRILAVSFLAMMILPTPARADPASQHFDPWSTPIQPMTNSDAAWGDFDGDGDLDLVVCGMTNAGRVTKTYRNTSGTMVELAQTGLVGIDNEGSGCLAWGDYDGDGDLDLAMAGATDGGRIARIYRNNGAGTLTHDSAQVLAGVASASVAWGDYDNDGDLDLLVMGHNGTSCTTTLYKNHPLGTMSPAPGISLVGLAAGSADWVDWDNDRDPDLLLTGSDGSNPRVVFYKNHPPGTLTADGTHGLPGVSLSDAGWGDYDNNGILDLAYTGATGAGQAIGRIYHNDGTGALTQAAILEPDYRSSVAWGDYDNDGDLDIALCGYTGFSVATYIYKNTAGAFSGEFALQGVCEGSATWADVDGDRDLDILVMGNEFGTKYTQLYRNEEATPNTAPAPPTSVTASYDAGNGTLHLNWSGATDSQTPSQGLYYCLRVGSAPGANDVVSGTYGSPLMGNAGQATDVVLHVPAPAPAYHAGVKAIDTGLMASSWATGETGGDSLNVAVDQIQLIWGRSELDSRAQFRLNPGLSTQIRAQIRPYVSMTINYFINHQPVRTVGHECWQAYNASCPGSAHWPNCSDGDCPSINDGLGHTYPGTCADNTSRCTFWIDCACVYSQEVEDSGWIAWDPSMQTAQVRVDVVSGGTECTLDDNIMEISIPNPVAVPGAPLPARPALLGSAPNPFSGTTWVRFVLPEAGPVRLEIFDCAGRLVRHLFAGIVAGGFETLEWDGRADDGRNVGPGAYFCRLTAGSESRPSTMLVVR